jgi:hypothetical protein
MAIYAPTSTSNNSHKQVASLVKANSETNSVVELSSITIDGVTYKTKSLDNIE